MKNVFVRISNCKFNKCSEKEKNAASTWGQYTDPQGNCLGEKNEIVDFNTPNVKADLGYLKVYDMADYKADEIIRYAKDDNINVVAVSIEGDTTFVVQIFMILKDYYTCCTPVFDGDEFVQYRKFQ